MADDIAKGIVRREQDLAPVSTLAVALQDSSRHRALLLASGGEAHDVNFIIGNACTRRHPHFSGSNGTGMYRYVSAWNV